MQSIFTYDPEPPRVASPWRSGKSRSSARDVTNEDEFERVTRNVEAVDYDYPDELCIDKLEAEPQEGPMEYKVHLLLRPRRIAFTTEGNRSAAGSQLGRNTNSTLNNGVIDQAGTSQLPLASSNSTRQHRLEQLTTQLLWRLQQSSPLHSISASNSILPSLPDASGDLLKPYKPAKLLPGLEESSGALYEIGVRDDGSFAGLTRDEMNESLNNLQAMAASLGCVTEVLRLVRIGTAECVQKFENPGNAHPSSQLEHLYVAEVYVKPVLEQHEEGINQRGSSPAKTREGMKQKGTDLPEQFPKTARDQLRATLTGATTSGKSSLLGTLSTSTLDNGHGQSRLSLLKHRHEQFSGMTSSVTQELIGYTNDVAANYEGRVSCIINYSKDNISSWNDIHAASSAGRLALISDSAGHPRYRRTIIRGLLGWAPHWTMLCFPASEHEDVLSRTDFLPSDSESRMSSGASAHISMAQLELCLRLKLPLIIVVTKLDKASKSTFKQVLSTILSSLKSSDRKPVMVANNNESTGTQSLDGFSINDITEARRVGEMIKDEGPSIVPIVFTSAVSGAGIGKIHALLRHLPLRADNLQKSLQTPKESHPTIVFHIDDFFKLNSRMAPGRERELGLGSTIDGSVVSGHLSRGEVTVGQEMLLGPFSSLLGRSHDDTEEQPFSNPDDPFLTPRSFTDALAKATAPPTQAASIESEWRRVRVVSARNLRLPVQTLLMDHAGTLGVVPLNDEPERSPLAVRRGMILTNCSLEAIYSLTAEFELDDASSLLVGNRVVIYSLSVRSSAKVVAVALHNDDQPSSRSESTWTGRDVDEELAFSMDVEDSMRGEASSAVKGKILVTLQLDSYREWIEIGAKILVMPGGGPGIRSGDRGIKGLAGLEGFVGRVMETFG